MSVETITVFIPTSEVNRVLAEGKVPSSFSYTQDPAQPEPQAQIRIKVETLQTWQTRKQLLKG